MVLLASHALAIGALATIFTFAWLFNPDEKTVYTGGLSFLAWGFLAVRGTEVAVVSNGTVVDAPLSPELRAFCGLQAFVALSVVLLYTQDAYPPRSGAGINQDGA